MKQWTEDEYLSNNIWYHATQANYARAIIKNGIIANINKNKPLDFGYGFYLTENKQWAMKYLKEQLLISEDDATPDVNDGYILEFHFVPREHCEAFKHRFFSYLDNEFAQFVFRNRKYYKYHIFTKCAHRYDMIAGPMSDGNQIDDFLDYELGRITKGELYEKLLLPKEDWQLVLHNQKLCDKLILAKVYNLKGDEVDVPAV